MARELEVCPDAVVRNNIMLVLCDLCMRSVPVLFVPTRSAPPSSTVTRKRLGRAGTPR